MSEQMKAVFLAMNNGVAELEYGTVPKPVATGSKVLVKVNAVGVNRTDLRRNQEHAAVGDGPTIAGLEIAGEIVALGPEARGLEVGDRIAAMTVGAYAQYALVDDFLAIKLPSEISWETAASIPVWYMTAHDALMTAGRFKSGQSVLVLAGASGIGIATVQIAKTLGAGFIVATTSSAEKAGRLKTLGLDLAVDPKAERLHEKVLAATAGKGVDVVIDMVGQGYLKEAVDSAKIGGRIVSVGRLGGFRDEIDLDHFAYKQLSLVGVTFRTRSDSQKRGVLDAMMADLWKPLETGCLSPPLDRSFRLSDAEEAQAYMAKDRHFGKVTLKID